MAGSPLEQFKITPIMDIPFEGVPGIGLSFTNSSLFMFVAISAIILFLTASMSRKAIIPGRWQNLAELTYEFVANMLKENVGEEGRKFFPFIFALFMFILFCNLLGMMPYSFTVTSHIIVTFAMAIVVFLGVTAVGFFRHGIKFLGFFLPSGTPTLLAPLMILIELFAYLARPVSLSIRLAANMMAGHTVLKVIAGFVVSLLAANGALVLGSILPFVFLIVLTGFEIFVAVLQAYIFTILVCVYLNDSVHLH